MKKWLYPLIIYLMGLAIILNFAFTTDYILISDSANEYKIYLSEIETGQWIKAGILNACLFTTFFPALIQRAIGADPLLVYKIYCCLLISFLPLVAYLLASCFLSSGYAAIASAFMMAQPCFLWSAAYARLNIALLFFMLLLLVIFNTRLRLRYKTLALIGCAAGLTTAHYSTSYAAVFILGLSLIGLGIWSGLRKQLIKSIKPISIAFLVLLVSIGVCGEVLGYTSIKYGKLFITRSVVEAVDIVRPGASEGIIVENDPGKVNPSYVALENRESVVQIAFGKTLSIMNWGQRIEFIFSWLSVIALSLGLLCVAWRQRKDSQSDPAFLILCSVCYLMILLAIAVPHISNWYGMAKTYYHALSLLAICFVIGGIKVSQWLRVKFCVVPLLILIPLFFCTTGGMHIIFGAVRDKFAIFG